MKDLREVILENSKLIYSIASKFGGNDIDDLFQAGCIGMMEAYKKFDVSKGVKFTTYAYPFILGRISEYVRENHTVRISKDMMRMKSKVGKVKEYLTQELMREPTDLELSEYLNVDVKNLNMVLNYQGDGVSLDEYYLDDLSLYDVISDGNWDYNNLIFVKQAIENLEEPERTIMIKRYFEDMTQSEIAGSLGLSQVDISRREKKVLIKLRANGN